MSDAQTIVDYTNQAQYRVTADTETLTRSATLAVPTTGTATLPTDAIRLTSIANGTTNLNPLPIQAVLAYLSSANVVVGDASFGVIGRTVYILPLPSQALSLDITYVARASSWDSDEDLQVTGPCEDLVDRLIIATMQLDSGESGLAIAGLSTYAIDSMRLKYLTASRAGPPIRMRVAGANMP